MIDTDRSIQNTVDEINKLATDLNITDEDIDLTEYDYIDED